MPDDSILMLMDFWSPDCHVCENLLKLLHEIAEERDDVKLIATNVFEDIDMCLEYKIQELPTLVFEKNGEIVHRMLGSQVKEDILEKIEEFK